MVDAALRSRTLRTAIEAKMATSFTGALSPRPFVQRTLLGFGIAELDAVAGGGVPAGALTELVGAGSSGKTSAAMRAAATAMQSGRMCAWVDASDHFDPWTGAANGMLLPQLLWVRCGNQAAACVPAGREGVMLAEAAVDRATAMAPGRCGSHPRGEAQGLDRAVSSLFQSADMQQSAWPEGSRTGMHSTRNRQQVGTPGAPNLSIAAASPYRRASFQPVPRQEQVASDRQGGRKVQAAGERKPAVPAAAGHRLQTSRKPPSHMPPWTRLDQAMRAADLLLQGGGFSVLVLDLGSLAPEHVLRIPAATWFRFRAMAEASGTACILLSQAACARSSAALVLRFKPLRMELAGGTVVASVRYEAELARQRFQAGVNEEPDSDRQPAPVRKPPQATWQASPYSDWIAAPALPMRVAAGEGGAASVKKQAEARAGVLAWKSPGAAVAQDKKP